MTITTTPLETKWNELYKRGFYLSDIKLTEVGNYRHFEARDDNGIDYDIIENTHGELEIYSGYHRVFSL